MNHLTVNGDPMMIDVVRRMSTAIVMESVTGKKPTKSLWITRVHNTLSGLLGIGSVLIVIGIGGSNQWAKNNGLWNNNIHEMEIQEYYGTRFFAVFGLISTVLSFFIYKAHLDFNRVHKKKWVTYVFVFFLTMSFLTTFLALWIWSDLLRHIRRENQHRFSTPIDIKKDYGHMVIFYKQFIRLFYNIGANETNQEFMQSQEPRWKLGWSYWVTVIGDVVMFSANLLFFIQNDFREKDAHNEAMKNKAMENDSKTPAPVASHV